MMTLLGYVFLFALLWLMYVSRKYENVNKLYFIAGKKGAGKTTDICKLSMKYIKKGIPVFSTERMPGTYLIEPEDIGPYEFPRGAVIFIDEAGLVWHARDFKTFSKVVRRWFKLQRHRKLRVYMYSQSYDIDKALRDLCDEIWIMKSYFNVFSVKRKVLKDLTIVEAGPEADSHFAENLRMVPWIVPGATQITYTPRYHKYFDSFSAEALEEKKFEYVPKKVFSVFHPRVQLYLGVVELRRFVCTVRVKLLTEIYKRGWIEWL